jgi:hypothetical protein
MNISAFICADAQSVLDLHSNMQKVYLQHTRVYGNGPSEEKGMHFLLGWSSLLFS